MLGVKPKIVSPQLNQGKVRNEHQQIETKVSSVDKVQPIKASNKDPQVNNEKRICGGSIKLAQATRK